MTKTPVGLPDSWPPTTNGTTTWLKVAVYFGVGTVFAAYLLWFLTTTMAAGQAALTKTLNEHVAASAFYLRAICVNVSTNETQRALCEPREH